MEGLLNELGKQGILGLLLAISLTLNFIIGKMLLAEKDKRIESAEKNRDEIANPLKYIKDSLELIERKIRISKGEDV